MLHTLSLVVAERVVGTVNTNLEVFGLTQPGTEPESNRFSCRLSTRLLIVFFFFVFCFFCTESNVGVVVPRKKGGLLVGADHHFSFLDEETGNVERIQEINTEFPHSRFNDGKMRSCGKVLGR